MYTEVQRNFIQNLCSYTDYFLKWENSICGTLWLVSGIIFHTNIRAQHSPQSYQNRFFRNKKIQHKYRKNDVTSLKDAVTSGSDAEENGWDALELPPLRILGYLINNVNGIYKHFKVTKASVSGRGLFKLKDNADVRVAEGKTISNKFNQD